MSRSPYEWLTELPLDPGGIGAPDDEDPELRVELTGPLQARLSALERAL